MSNSASKWLTQLYMLTPGKDPWHSVFRSELVSSRITHTHALVMLVLHFDRTQHWHSPGRCSKRELCSRTRMRRWERNEHTFRSVQMIGSSSREKRVTSVSPERDRNIQSGMIIHPAETLLVLCLLAQRPETELYVPARPTPTAWKPGERTCDTGYGRSVRERGKQPTGRKP